MECKLLKLYPKNLILPDKTQSLIVRHNWKVWCLKRPLFLLFRQAQKLTKVQQSERVLANPETWVSAPPSWNGVPYLTIGKPDKQSTQKCQTGRGYVSFQEAEVCCCFRYQKKNVVLQLMDSSPHPYSWEADLWWKSHTVLQTSLSWAYAKSSSDRALGKPPRSVNVNFACQLCRDVSHRSCEPREKKNS